MDSNDKITKTEYAAMGLAVLWMLCGAVVAGILTAHVLNWGG